MTPAPTPDRDARDTELARRIAAGGPDAAGAFTELRQLHERRLFAHLLTRFPRDAEDIAQETWLRAFRWLATSRQVTNFPGWLFAVAENYGIDRVRPPRAKPLGNHDLPAKAPAPLDGLIDRERRDALRECLDSLPNERRVVIVSILEGEKPDAIAARLGVNRTTIDTRKHRGIADLTACMERKLKENPTPKKAT